MPETDTRPGAGGAVAAPGDSPICFCFNVTERDVEQHFADGAGTYESLVEKTKIGTKCTACLLDLDLVLDRIHQARNTTIIADGDDGARRSGLHHALDFVDSGFFIHDDTIRTAVRLSNFSQLFGAGAACVPFNYELVIFSEAGKAVGRRTGYVASERDVTVEVAPDDGTAMRGWFLLALTAREDGFFGTMRPQVALRGTGWCATYHTQPHMMASVGRYRHEVVLQGDGSDLSALVVVVNGSRQTASGALVLRDPQNGTERESAFNLPGNGCCTLDLARAFPGAPADRPLFVLVRCDRPTRNHIVNIHADASLSVDHFPELTMQDSPNFHYLTPLLFPLFPTCGGQLRIGFDLQKVLDIRGTAGFDGNLHVSYFVYLDGRLAAQEDVHARVVAGTVKNPYLWRDYSAERMGYVEVAITADSPVFRRIDLPVGYAVLGMPNFGSLTVIPDAKFARPIIVEQMQATKAFCLVHSASHWDGTADRGNSLLFVNPYEQDIVATIQAVGGRKARQRVRAKEAVFVPVNRVLADGEWSCTMVTANNRIPAWDVRHRASDARYVNRIDHLDVFRGNRTYADLRLPQITKLYARRAMRRLGKVF